MIEHLFFACFLIFGIHVLFRDNMILGNLIPDYFPKWFVKPLVGCPACMASFWGSFYYVAFVSNNWPEWIMFCLMLSGLNWIINGIIG